MTSEGRSMDNVTATKIRMALHDFDELIEQGTHVPYAFTFAAEKHGLTVDQLKGHIEYQYDLITVPDLTIEK